MYSRKNSGYKHILVIIDVYSSRNWVRALKTLTAPETASQIKDIIESMDQVPSSFSSDAGKEYTPSLGGTFGSILNCLFIIQ
jgi:hypothetical protein